MLEATESLNEILAIPWVRSASRVLLTVLAAMLLVWLVDRAMHRFGRFARERGELLPSEGIKRIDTLQGVVHYVAIFLIGLIALLVILREVGVDIAPLIAGAGIAGLAIGFGTQNLVRDFFTGIFIMIEGQYRVGDRVRIGGAGGVGGRVEAVTLRITRLRDSDGNLHVIPNGSISLVSNLTKGWARAVLDVAVGYGEDTDHVMEVLTSIGEEMSQDESLRADLSGPLEVLGVQDLADSAVIIRVRFTTPPDARWRVQREMRRRVKKRFDADGIEIPFPHRTLYMGDAGAKAAGGSSVAD
jgi:small conductance mechanosensitive channel